MFHWQIIKATSTVFTLDAPFQRGDILYVRETWRCLEASYPPGRCIIEYKAGGNKEFQVVFALPTQKGEWKPSIHMPKSVARLFIRVTDVRVERLKNISASSAMDEGFTDWNDFVAMWDSTVPTAMLSERGWDANPWVLVIEFERIRKDV